MWLLAICFLYLGFLLGFYLSILPSSMLFSKFIVGYGNEIVAYYAIVLGSGEIIGKNILFSVTFSSLETKHCKYYLNL